MCPHCFAPDVNWHDNHCYSCGKKVESRYDGSFFGQQSERCPNCRKAIDGKRREVIYCVQCGVNIEDYKRQQREYRRQEQERMSKDTK